MAARVYLPGLNGIRALAALSVVFSHVNNRLGYYGLPTRGGLLDLAGFGVTMFFTLSGFLITYLLLKEKEQTGTIAIKAFYVRRVLRIWPLYFAYLLIVLCLDGFESVRWPILFTLLMIPNLRNSFVHITNIAPGNSVLSNMIGHYWSLGVEEQFYAFWPWVVRKVTRLLPFLALFPLLLVLTKVLLRLGHAGQGVMALFNYTRFGCLTIGALGAYLYFNGSTRVVRLATRPWTEVLAWLFLLLAALDRFHITSIIDHEIFSVVTLVIIFNQVANPRRLVNLERRVFDYLGTISYGLYVFNPLMIYLLSFVVNRLPLPDPTVKLAVVYALSLAGVIALAHLSYYYFERRFLLLKRRFTVVESAASQADFREKSSEAK